MTDIATHTRTDPPAPVDALAMWKKVLQELQELQDGAAPPAPDAVGGEEG